MRNIFLFLLIVVGMMNAKVLKVPQDFSKIQSAINASVNGDTVVISPGTYYENINFKGKNIVVTSRFYENNDMTFILNTVINGSQPSHPDTASCVLIISGENSSAVLQGLTITEGKGTAWTDEHGAGIYREGGGVLAALSSPTIRFNYIINNEIFNVTKVASTGGGGMRIGDGSPIVENNVITLNKAHYGGGIVLNYCAGAIVRNNMVVENSVRQYAAGVPGYGGGGLWLNSQKPGDGSPNIIENNTVYGNVALDLPNVSFAAGKGGGLVVANGVKAVIQNNIIWENHSSFQISSLAVLNANATVAYNNITGGYPGTSNIDVDPQFADTSFILKPASLCVDAGDTSSAFNDPLLNATAKYPAQGSVRNDIGVYGGPKSSHVVPFSRPSLFTPNENLSNKYILPGDSTFVPFTVYNFGSKSAFIDSIGFTSAAFSIKEILPKVLGVNSSEVMNVWWKPTQNKKYTDTMFIYHNSSFIKNPLSIALYGNAVATPLMSVDLSDHNFGTYDINTSLVDTTIFVFNKGTGKDSITVSINPVSVTPSVALTISAAAFTLMPGDSQGVTFGFSPKQIKKTFTGNYAPKILFKSFFGEDTTTVEKIMRFRLTGTLHASHTDQLPKEFALKQNYPNPFNPSTIISFDISSSGFTSVKIFDAVGKEIATLVNEELREGSYEVPFDASKLSSGLYFYTMRSGNFFSVKKMMVLK